MMTDTIQKATLPKGSIHNAKNLGGQKELVRYLSVVGLRKGKMHETICIRWYMARSGDGASPVYCSAWIHDTRRQREYTGYGSAHGYGYHKESAALAWALSSAGIKLSHPIDGVGDTALRGACEAIMRALGYRKWHVVEG